MAPWDETFPKTCHVSRKALLHMEMEKVANEAVEELMNLVKRLSQKSIEELALEDEEMLEGHIYEESYQEDPDEVSHVEDPDETFVSMLPLDEDEVLISSLPFDEDIQASVPPAHQEENMMSCNPFEILMILYSMILEVKKY
jgi:hypothetical protein